MNVTRDGNRGAAPRAFTLVELLLVITIIGMLAAVTLFSLQGVREDTKVRRARSQVAKINELIMTQWETYRTRAIPVTRNTDISNPPYVFANPQSAAQLLNNRQIRLLALRQLMRMEMPDRKSDLTLTGGTALLSPPSRWLAYRRRAQAQLGNPADWSNWSPLHQQSECLYLILATMRDGDTTGLDFFAEDEIGDVDNDGMPEVLDPWGVPICFLRWAPGYRSDLQPGDQEIALDGNAGLGNGDPFDPLKVDPRWSDGILYNDPQLLFPLIISAGKDQQFDLLVDFLDVPFPSPLPAVLDHNAPPSVTSPWQNFTNDPYVFFEHPTLSDPLWGNIVQIGLPADVNGDGVDGNSDNITNHFVE